MCAKSRICKKKKNGAKRGGRERIQSSQECVRARASVSARGAHVFRFLLVSLALTGAATTPLRATTLLTRVCSFTRLLTGATRRRARQDNEGEGAVRQERRSELGVVALRAKYIQQVISRHFRRHFCYRDGGAANAASGSITLERERGSRSRAGRSAKSPSRRGLRVCVRPVGGRVVLARDEPSSAWRANKILYLFLVEPSCIVIRDVRPPCTTVRRSFAAAIISRKGRGEDSANRSKS